MISANWRNNMTKFDEKLEIVKKESEKLSPQANEIVKELIELAKAYSNFTEAVKKNTKIDK